jgi:hypothetical protein
MQTFTKRITNYSKKNSIVFLSICIFFLEKLYKNSTTYTRQWEGVVPHHGINNTTNQQ